MIGLEARKPVDVAARRGRLATKPSRADRHQRRTRSGSPVASLSAGAACRGCEDDVRRLSPTSSPHALAAARCRPSAQRYSISISALDPSELAAVLAECRNEPAPSDVSETISRSRFGAIRLLLRARRERPRRRAAEQRDELATYHSITSSARASTTLALEAKRFGGLEVDHEFVLGRLCTGRSAGFSPLRMRST